MRRQPSNRSRGHGARARAGNGASTGPKGWLALASLLALVAVPAWAGLPVWLPGIYLGMSLATLGTYALDKRAAQAGNRRTPENTLHLMALLGGWPGAMAAQHWLRHKSSKASFLAMFWATVLLNLIVLAYGISKSLS